MGYSFTDLGAEGCRRSLNALLILVLLFASSRPNDNIPRWMPWDLSDDKSTLVQVMASCRQAISHYLSQCWPSSVSPYGVIGPQWVKTYEGAECDIKSGSLVMAANVKTFEGAKDTVISTFKTINNYHFFSKYSPKHAKIACRWGWGMECSLWVHTVVLILHLPWPRVAIYYQVQC